MERANSGFTDAGCSLNLVRNQNYIRLYLEYYHSRKFAFWNIIFNYGFLQGFIKGQIRRMDDFYLMIFRLVVIITTTLVYNQSSFNSTLIDSIAIIIYVAIIILGTRVNNFKPNT